MSELVLGSLDDSRHSATSRQEKRRAAVAGCWPPCQTAGTQCYAGAFNGDRVPSKPLRIPSSTSQRSDHSRRQPLWESSFLSGSSASKTVDSSRHPSRQQGLIEIAPGVNLALRGSEETWAAVREDFYLPGLCWGCPETIFVIQDAAFILCPTCLTVSPIDGSFDDPQVAGVGLGFTFDDLTVWQREIDAERTSNSVH
jgi:hypothetical protein